MGQTVISTAVEIQLVPVACSHILAWMLLRKGTTP
jgi:hypothetical protein